LLTSKRLSLALGVFGQPAVVAEVIAGILPVRSLPA
jgi:Kef-type K+ transport system membrane component KefB